MEDLGKAFLSLVKPDKTKRGLFRGFKDGKILESCLPICLGPFA